MPPRKRTDIKDSGPKPRIQVLCSKNQHAAITTAAYDAGSNASTFVLAHAMRAINNRNELGLETPLIIGGKVADTIRRLADDQGISTDSMLEQLVIGVSP